MDSDDDSYGIGDDSDDVSSDSSDDYGAEVGGKRKRGSFEERARAAAAAAVIEKDCSDLNTGIQCIVCLENGKRGYVPNLVGLLQHCRTKEEFGARHKKFLEIIEEEIKAQPTPGPSAEPDVEGRNVLDLQKKMAAVTPFILVLQNIGSMGVDELCEAVASIAKEKPVVVLPDSKCFAFAILERFRSLELAHATFEARCRDRVHWNAFCMRMDYNTAQGSQQIFGYMANHEDMQHLDPNRKAVAWEIQDFSDAVMQPHREALEEQQQLILQARELDGEVRKALHDYEHYQSIHVKWAKAVEDAKCLVSQRQEWLEQETAVLEKEKEYSEKRFKQEKESLKKEHERKVKELEEMEKYQATANNGMDVQENLDRLRLEVKNAEKEVEKVNSDHDKFVQEVIRNKRELDERKKQKSAMEAEWELNAKRKKELLESEKRTNEEIARLQKDLEKRSNDDTSTSQQHMENLKFLEECGLTTDRLRQITISACKSCGVKLSKPPKPSQINHPKYSEALKKARVLLRPCGCITICSGCAPKAVKARRCPCCNKQFTQNEKMEEVPFPIFGYITLE